MDPLATAAFTSWTLNAPANLVLLSAVLIYVRGWLRGRRIIQYPDDAQKLICFVAGILLVFLALESPLDAFDILFLSAHMTQHLLLMMFAPLLVLLGDPALPMLRGLPKPFVKEGLAPFLTWRPLQRVFEWLVSPPVAWLAFAFSTVFWHLPAFYELALRSPAWHGVQHACFFWSGILFWWPLLRSERSGGKWPSWIKIPYLLFADIVNTLISAMFVFSGHLLYPSYGTLRASSLSPQDDQTIAGLIMWVPGSLIYLVPAFLLVMRLFTPVRQQRRAAGKRIRPADGRLQTRARKSWLRLTTLRRPAQFIMLLIAIAVMLDGWRGPQVAPLNLAGVLPWIHWRALSLVALLIVGNLFCMSCPFTLVRDGWRKLQPPTLRWPRALRNKWLSATLLLLYLWAYEAFGLWDSPWLTAWIIAGYFVTALVIDGLFRGASFCKYVCPIGQFHFVTSLLSPAEIRVKKAEVCNSCRTYDCIRGNDRQRGCELNLFQPKKSGNLDCTFCLDCVKACPHANVALLPVIPAQTIATATVQRSSIGKLAKRTDFAVLASIFVCGAFANAAGMTGPVLTWEHGWHARFGPHAMPWIVGAFTLLVTLLFPAIAILACGALNRLVKIQEKWPDLVRQLVFAAVPLGVGMWAAHLLYHFAISWSAAWPALARVASLAAAEAPIASIPGWLTAAQILLLDAGLLATLYLAWRAAVSAGETRKPAIAIVLPWAVCFSGLYLVGAWILFQPMQMRGMMMP